MSDEEYRRLERKIANVGWLATHAASFSFAAFIDFCAMVNFHIGRGAATGVFFVAYFIAWAAIQHILEKAD